MANFGLSCPIIAKLNVNTGKYSDMFRCGKAVNTSVTPNYATGTLYADNAKAEEVKEFKDATINLEVDSMPIKAAEVVFGHKVEEDGTITERASDEGNYVGYGFVARELNNGRKQYRACILLKAKFQEGEESYTTKGDNITFGTPKLSGAAEQIGVGDEPEEWRKKSPFCENQKEALNWIEKEFDAMAETGGGAGTGEAGTGGSEQGAE